MASRGSMDVQPGTDLGPIVQQMKGEERECGMKTKRNCSTRQLSETETLSRIDGEAASDDQRDRPGWGKCNTRGRQGRTRLEGYRYDQGAESTEVPHSAKRKPLGPLTQPCAVVQSFGQK